MARERNRFEGEKEEEEDRISLLGISRSCSIGASNNRTTEVRVPSPLPTPSFPSSPNSLRTVKVRSLTVTSRVRGARRLRGGGNQRWGVRMRFRREGSMRVRTRTREREG